MFGKKNNQSFNPNPFGGYYDQMNPQYGNVPPQMDPNQSTMFPQFQTERIQYEIRENRRRINNLAKRITRIENYLRIRDNSDYSIAEDEVPGPF